jgi:molybdopterin molybdotransferase
MISVAEAELRILEAVEPGPVERCALQASAGRILRSPLRADRASPPFDRVMMDGYAIAQSAFDQGRRDFTIQGTVAAGEPAPALKTVDQAIEVMTGGVLPEGCDTVIPVEWCQNRDEQIHIEAPRSVHAGLYVHEFASDGEAGRVVLEAGSRLDPPALAVAANEGAASIRVTRRPRIFLLTTGDEVVAANARPEPWQIRGTHEHALGGLFASWGPCEFRHAHARDEESELKHRLKDGIDFADVVLTVGGVSRGKWDLVPEVLEELGVERRFHRVAQRPGLPLWFGARSRQLVFGLPGNPVSALCSARRYVWPALDRWAGLTSTPVPRVRLTQALDPLPDATRFVPVRLADDGAIASTPRTSGSLHALAGTHGFVECSPGSKPIAATTALPYFGWKP